jgi:L-lactate dehydrogenase complex protein LldG
MKNKTSPVDTLKESTTREKVLKKVRNALLEPSENPFPELDFDSPVYTRPTEEKDVQFAIEFTKLGGNFIYCQSPSDMLVKVKALFEDHGWKTANCNDDLIKGLLDYAGIKVENTGVSFMNVTVTSCECLISRTGSVMVSSGLQSGRKLPLATDIHVVIAFTSQVVEDIKHAIEFIKFKYNNNMPSMLSIISGTSRSDDIERVMVPAGHSAKEIYVFMADEDNTEN